MSNNTEIIKLKRAKFWKENGILFCEILNPDESVNLNEDTVDTYLKAVTILCEGKKMPFLIDLRNTKGAFLNSAAKKLANSKELTKLSLTEAYVVNSFQVKLLIKSYKRIYEPKRPFGIFKDFNEALNYSINTKNVVYGSN